MLKTTVKSLSRQLGYDVIRTNGGGDAQLSRGTLSTFSHKGEEVSMLVLNEWDYIQSHHLKGKFYEEDELGLMAGHICGGVFVDVGANIGNHSVYALKFLGARKVIAFEPNPAAARILKVNIALNDLSARFTHHLCGLSDTQSSASLIAPRHNDLGSFRLAQQDGGECPIVRGDEILDGEPKVDFIKIDTEAMEMAVLAGLEATIARHRPVLFVEVDDANRAAFMAFTKAHGYVLAATHRRYETNCNYLVVPSATLPSAA